MRSILTNILSIPILLLILVRGLLWYRNEFIPELEMEGWMGLAFLGLALCIVYIDNIFMRIKWRRRANYGKALAPVTKAFSEIHEFNRISNERSEEPDISQIAPRLKHVCNNLAYGFKSITNKECSVCIKVLSSDNNYEVYTLCRDAFSTDRDQIDGVEDVIHTVDKNSDFNELMDAQQRGGGQFYISNILPLRFDYQNSSFLVRGYPKLFGREIKYDKNYILNFFKIPLMLFRWSLPYKSTIIAPIVPKGKAFGDDSKVQGFLCVDSKYMFLFQTYYDKDFLIGIADGIYNLMLSIPENNS